MNYTTRRALALLFMVGALLCFSGVAWATGETYVIPIRGDIDNSNWLFIERAYKEAKTNGAAAIIFEIDTYGGYIDTAIKISDLIVASSIPAYCYVDTKAISAGSLIALSGETLLMSPGATMGAAEPRLMGQTADYKVLSMWVGRLTSVAEARGRDGQIAAAFADVDIVIEGLTEPGKLLTLTATQAVEYQMADNICNSRAELIALYELPATVVEMEKSFQEKSSGWLSDPWVSGILLAIGIAGIVIELITAGSFGIFGAAGLVGFALYFMGHFWAGNIGVGAILLFIVGLILIVLEIFVIPGFGITGILGILSVLASLVLASPDFTQAMLTLGGSLTAAIIIILITLRNRKTRKVWGKLILAHKLETGEGYVSHDQDLPYYMGKRGKALTMLRPAGTVDIEGRRVDVVTMGEFIEAGSAVEVILVEGMRVVVRAL
ncbi:MAG: nodulation protein NfeD [Clostridiales bacterium]|nr:nodulation protein NfeD [Clostridiales bacterium]